MRALNSIRAAMGALALVFTATTYADPKVEEQLVGPAAQDAKYVISPQGAHLATVARKGSRMMVTVDGVAGPKVDEVITPVAAYIDPRPVQAMSSAEQQQPQNRPQPVTFSKDGNHFAYVARVGQEWLLMQDSKEVLRLSATGAVGATGGIGGMAGNTDIRLQFGGNDGEHLYFAKFGIAGYELWVDGQKMPGYYSSAGSGEGALDPLISPDGAHFIYLATMGTHPGDQRALMIDGKETGYLAENLLLSGDGRHLIGIQHAKDGDHLLVDGKSRFAAKAILEVHVAPVGNRILLVLRHTNPNGSLGQFLLVDGKPAEATLSEQIKQVVFSPDGKRYAAVCGRPGAEFVVVDGKKGQEYQFINQPVAGLSCGVTFSPDSSRVGYVANANGKSFLVIDEEESDAFDNSPLFRFLPGGKRLITSGKQGENFPFTLDGKVVKLPPGTTAQLDSFTLSPDGSHYAFLVCGGGGGAVADYLDGKDTGLVGTFTFSPDSKHLAVVGHRYADNNGGLFVDGILVYPMVQSITHRAFSPDSEHLFWMSQEPVSTPNPADAFEWVTYADGKPVARNDRSPAAQTLLFPNGISQFDKTVPGWSVGPDGALTMLAPTPDGIKRIKATPGADTSLASVLETARAAEAKAKTEADPKFQQAKRDREVAEARRKAAEAKAARLAEQKR